MSGQDEQKLVDRCRQGEEEAWRELVDRFGQKVYSVAYHFTLKREDAEELSQEIFLKIFESLDRYNGGFPLIAWIVALSRNLCIDRYRRRRGTSFRFVSDDAVAPMLRSADDPAAEALKKERTKILFSAGGNPRRPRGDSGAPRSRRLAYEEIGKALELPDGTVKSRLFRARAGWPARSASGTGGRMEAFSPLWPSRREPS